MSGPDVLVVGGTTGWEGKLGYWEPQDDSPQFVEILRPADEPHAYIVIVGGEEKVARCSDLSPLSGFEKKEQ